MKRITEDVLLYYATYWSLWFTGGLVLAVPVVWVLTYLGAVSGSDTFTVGAVVGTLGTKVAEELTKSWRARLTGKACGS